MEALMKAVHPPYTRFPGPSDSVLVKTDLFFTTLACRAPLFEPLQCVVFMVGHLFGCPTLAVLALPGFFLTGRPGDEWQGQAVQGYRMFCAAVAIVSLLLVYTSRIEYEDLFKGKLVFSGAAVSLGALFCIDRRAFSASCVFYVCWGFLTLFAWVLKGYFLRKRPAASMTPAKLAQYPRYARKGIWRKTIDKNRTGKNAAHSFPSFDSATAGLVLGMLLTMEEHGQASALLRSASSLADFCSSAPTVAISASLMLVAMYGRVYAFAHHVVDVLVGAGLGVVLPFVVARFTGTHGGGGWHLVWAFVTLFGVAIFFFVPGAGIFLSLAMAVGTGFLSPSVSWVVVALYGGLLWLISTVYHAQSKRVKPWVVARVKEYFDTVKDPEDFPDHLKRLLADKRKEFLDECAEPGSVFPGNLYIASKFLKDTHFVMDWETLQRTFLKRLDHFVEWTGTDPANIDIIVGIYSGGAFFAPLLAEELGRPYCFIKASRYKQLKLSFFEFGKTALMRAIGMHDKAYKLGKLPEKSQFKNKNVLLVDDACVSGGTFRAVARFCKDAGANEVRGLAFAGSKSNASHIWDPTMTKKPTEQKGIHMPAFSPWGSF
jgi:adenine/guanine phosphoribosyltransferase-like PRPP-binding protein